MKKSGFRNKLPTGQRPQPGQVKYREGPPTPGPKDGLVKGTKTTPAYRVKTSPLTEQQVMPTDGA